MSLFYVSVVIVVEGDDEGHAEGVAESILESVTDLKPKSLDGYTLLKSFATTPASTNWIERDQKISIEVGKGISITEEYSS